ncbi:nitrilase-related carbon-nitrogen hydrolase [Vaginella massiliensis]|uniref:nitrilase-related carbon-nitrogen hydrolase n=1 Tax=Vaginella massiliensis TaxID=1816680 RepID=UPI000838D4DD|nr:nitrilase-related carbon-nitrogen hydrolase [Vaginella massiliensis]
MQNESLLRISLIQFDVIWEDREANFAYMDQLLKHHRSDLILLPEMFASGFSMNVEKIAEKPFGPSFEWMQTKAKELNSAIAGSISTKEADLYFNRFYFVTPEGAIYIYDKKHLFGYGKEADVYSAGDRIVSIYYKGWKIRPIVCYDLRFPVWCRNTDEYDLLLCNASWPQARRHAWMTLLQARAMENMAFVAGVNRIGTDGYDLVYQGDSKMFDELGQEMENLSQHAEILSFELDRDKMWRTRKHFGFLNDRDDFVLEL